MNQQYISLETYELILWAFSTFNSFSYILAALLCFRWLNMVKRSKKGRTVFISLIVAFVLIAVARFIVSIYFDNYLVRLVIPVTHLISNYLMLYAFYRATVYFERLQPATASREAIDAMELVSNDIAARLLNDEPVRMSEIKHYQSLEYKSV